MFESEINSKSDIDCGSFIFCSNKQQNSGQNETLCKIYNNCY